MSDARPPGWPADFPYGPQLRFCTLGNENVTEVMESFRLACERLGHPTSIATTPSTDNADINLFFFAMGLDWPHEEDLPLNAIVVNFEPALPELLDAMPGYRHLLQRAYVWDYSLENMVHHRGLGIFRSDHVPLTFEPDATPLLPEDRVLGDAQQDIDVIFFGETTPRRLDVLRRLEACGLRVAYPFGKAWTPAERDALLLRAKVGLNMRKADNSATAELPRLSILLRHRKATVSELYAHSEIPPALRDAVEGCTSDEIVERVRALVADAPRRRALEQAGPAALLALPSQHEVLAAALRRYVAATRQRLACLDAMKQTDAAPRVSVLLVVCNDGPRIADALASIAAQTLPAHRIIVVDDGSTDGTAAIVRDRMHADPRLADLVLLRTPAPIGWASAAQWGLMQAQGDALALWDPAVRGEPRRLQVQAAFLRAAPSVGTVGCWYGRDGPEGDRNAGIQRLPETALPILAALLAHRPCGQPLLMGSLMFALPRIRQLGLGFDATLGRFAWMGLMLELVRRGAVPANLSTVLVRRAEGNAPPVTDSDSDTVALAHVRERLIPLVFPDLASIDAHRLARLYATEWASGASDATALLRDMAKACERHGDVQAAAVLRGECLRVLDVYAQNGRLPGGYVRELMHEPLLRDFLAPLGVRILDFAR